MTSSHLLGRWELCSQRYGAFHAALSYVGRWFPTLWKIIGRSVTAPYLGRWLRTQEVKIVNLGGGSNCMAECLTVDTDPRADAYVDITAPLPFPDSSIDGIFCEEAIEHVDKESAFTLLAECFRVLKPGGVIRVTTPDLDYFLRRALEDKPGADSEINDAFLNHGHRYLYTRNALENAISAADFMGIRFSSYRDPESRLGYLDSHADRLMHSPDMSMYVEAEKL